MREINYQEERVPDYKLPDLLVNSTGDPVRTAADWPARRSEILELFRTHVYGRMPGAPGQADTDTCRMTTSVLEQGEAMGGSALRRQIRVQLSTQRGEVAFEILLLTPTGAGQAVPVFLGLNFFGNQSIHPDPVIHLTQAWMRDSPENGIADQKATESSRGVRSSLWPVEEILERGYGLATIYYGELDPDHDDGFRDGVHALFPRSDRHDEWGSLAGWAWGLSRGLDALTQIDAIDSGRVAVMGHSRLGKTALWAGATDPRFALVISNDSGCGGAAASRRCFGETVASINERFPHWFCRAFRDYNDREESLPVDQHMLIALMAPRPVYVASAADDRWADPKGEFLSAREAGAAYELLGEPPLPVREMPPIGTSVAGKIGYHVRAGGHDVTDLDWSCFLDFADRVL